MLNRIKKFSCLIIITGLFLISGFVFTIPLHAEVPSEAQNGIPLVIVRADESKKTYQEMIESADQSVSLTGMIAFFVPYGYSSEYETEPSYMYSGNIDLEYIKGLNDANWATSDKKSYEICFKEKIALFGMGSHTKWALVAEGADATGIRTRLARWLGNRMGLEYNPKCVPVDLIIDCSLTGPRNLGSYYLTEIIEPEGIDSNTHELNELIFTANGAIGEELHHQIAGMIDLESLADYWLIQEFTLNCKGIRNDDSLYQKNGKFYFGHLGDFSEGWQDLEEEADGFNDITLDWCKELRAKDDLFLNLLNEEWTKLNSYLAEATQDGGIIDQYYSEIKASKQADMRLWSDDENRDVDAEYQASINSLKQWINTRQTWFNAHISEIGDAYYTLTYEVGDEVYQTLQVKNRTELDKGPVLQENEDFIGWIVKGTNKSHEKIVVYGDLTFTPIYTYTSIVPDNDINDNTPEVEPQETHNSVALIVICGVVVAGLVGGTVFVIIRSRKKKEE